MKRKFVLSGCIIAQSEQPSPGELYGAAEAVHTDMPPGKADSHSQCVEVSDGIGYLGAVSGGQSNLTRRLKQRRGRERLLR